MFPQSAHTGQMKLLAQGVRDIAEEKVLSQDDFLSALDDDFNNRSAGYLYSTHQFPRKSL